MRAVFCYGLNPTLAGHCRRNRCTFPSHTRRYLHSICRVPVHAIGILSGIPRQTEDGMPVLCLNLPRPGPQFRAVIVIIIYVTSLPALGLHAAVAGACGALAVQLALASAPAPATRRRPERAH
jgi:hypothetical protein